MSIKGRRIALVCGAAAAATVMVGSTAVAAPTKGPEFTVTCPGLGTFDVVTPPGQGAFTPAFRVGTHQVFIPYEISGTVTGVPGEDPFTFVDVKNAPVPADAITCTFAGTFTEGDVTVTVTGTVVVVQRGAP
jgi:hypothetical protein